MRRITDEKTGPARSASADVRQVLRRARLKYADPDSPGIRRRRTRGGFAFERASGGVIREAGTLDRIRKLAIPPAWEQVWISPDDRAHIQAVGRDARGRKQYRYHADWRKVRDEGKYDHVLEFAKALPKIRRAANRHLKLPGLPREKVLAAVVLVMEKTLIRVGNDEYAKQNQSYGLTTMQDRHVRVSGKRVKFRFRGKSGVEHDIDLASPRLATIVRQCRDLPGQELFQYVDHAGKVRDIGSADVNEYIHQVTGQKFTAKDYRTWAGTVLAAKALHEFEVAAPGKPVKKNLLRAIETVAERLGNTKAVCRKCYIHPAVMDAYLDGNLAQKLKAKAAAELNIAKRYGLDDHEESVLRMLERAL